MIPYLLKTDTLSYLLKKNHVSHQSILKQLLSQPEGGVTLSSISLAEIVRGLKNIKDQLAYNNLQEFIEKIFSTLVVLEFNEEAAWVYGKVLTELLKAGKDIEVMDALIASHALSQNLILVTNSTKHFANVAGLKFENWGSLSEGVTEKS